MAKAAALFPYRFERHRHRERHTAGHAERYIVPLPVAAERKKGRVIARGVAWESRAGEQLIGGPLRAGFGRLAELVDSVVAIPPD